MSKLTQEERVLKHLREYDSIDDTVARDHYGIRRLAAVIFKLREKGIVIETHSMSGKNRYDVDVTWAVYKLTKATVQTELIF